ncbi:MAG TPA: dihydrofolate reductase [Geobacter sp.]|nr:dihydrofolate reductase [Geobacter sp.]
MIISIIAAMSEDRVIGANGRLPWNIPADLARFKSITMGHAVLMGRKTYQSIGHPLEGRKNIVLTRTLSKIEGCQVARSLREGIAAVEGDEEIFICGGEEIFREALPICQRIYLTIVHGSYQGDIYFPELPGCFVESHREENPDASPPTSFMVLEKADRIQPGADAAELRQKGLEAVNRHLYFLARCCFQQALTLEESAETSSDYAFCLVKSSGDSQAAQALAETALQRDPENLRILLNVGRVQILAGAKERGLDTLRKGVQLGGGEEFLTELTRCGTRNDRPIKSLPRSHPLNRYLGLLMHRIDPPKRQ